MTAPDPDLMQEGALPQKVTQKTIAEAANVSQSLVSIVLSGGGKEASPEVRQRILDVAKELNYTPLRQRSVKMTRKLFALIRPVVKRGHHKEDWIYDSYEQFYLDLQEQVRLVLQREHYNLISHDDSDSESTMEWLRRWNVKGVFLNSSNNALLDQIREEFPVIELARSCHRNVDCVTSDDYERVAIAFDFLYQKGHRRIAYLGCAEQSERELYRYAYTECCRRNSVTEELVEVKSFNPGVLNYARAFAASKERPTAIMADPVRLLILQKHFLKLGVSVPRDVSLLSLDNISACRFMEPALVSVDLNFPALAEHAMNTLLFRMKEPDSARFKIEVTPHLMPGGSVNPPLGNEVPSTLLVTP